MLRRFSERQVAQVELAQSLCAHIARVHAGLELPFPGWIATRVVGHATRALVTTFLADGRGLRLRLIGSRRRVRILRFIHLDSSGIKLAGFWSRVCTVAI